MPRIFRALISLLLLLSFVFISIGGYAQVDPEDPSSYDPAVPVDGGITILLAAGAALGGRKLFVKSRKDRN